MSSDEAPQARCGVHPDAPAAVACWRCGAFACARCVRAADAERALCTSCEARLARGGISPRIRVALALACFAWVVLPGIAALWLAREEKLRVERGDASEDSLPWLGLATGMVVVQWVAVGLFFVGPTIVGD